jgi:beta-glucanase (GH16 family)
MAVQDLNTGDALWAPFSPVTVPPGTDFRQPHQYGFLWVPATATTQGYMEWYFDRVKIGKRVSWDLFNPALPPPPVAGSSAFSVLDTRHIALILGNGDPNNLVTVSAVQVWQLTAANNITDAPVVVHAPSPDNTTVQAGGGTIWDAGGHAWTIVAGVATRDGVADTSTSNVNMLLWWGGGLYYVTNAATWRVLVAFGNWIATTDPRVLPPAATDISLSNNTIAAGSPSGTVVGAIGVTTTGTFAGSLALSGTDATKFQVQTNTGPAPSFDSEFSAPQPWMAHNVYQAGDPWSWCSDAFLQGGLVLPDLKTWWLNPTNPNTQMAGVYTLANGMLNMGILPNPGGAIGNYINNQAGQTVDYVGGIISTQHAFRPLYGYFECSVAMDRVPGAGCHAEIEDYPGHDWSSEIDLEIWTDGSNVMHAAFDYSGWDSNGFWLNKVYEITTAQGFDGTVQHTYGWDWQSDKITYYMDDHQVAQVNTPTDGTFNNSMFYYFQTAASMSTGESGFGVYPDKAGPVPYAHIKYLKYWPSKPAAGSGGGTNLITSGVLGAGTDNINIVASASGKSSFSKPFAITVQSAAALGQLASFGASASSSTSILATFGLPTTGTIDHGGVLVQYKRNADSTWLDGVRGLVATMSGGTITDTQGKTWSINAGAQIVCNSNVDINTANATVVVLMPDGTAWHVNASGQWYSKPTSNGLSSGGWTGPIASPFTTAFTISGLTATVAYNVRGYAYNSSGNGAMSNVVNVTTSASVAGFTVTQANGIRDSAGNRWELRGYNCWWGEFNNIKANLYSKFPGANLVRVVCGRDTTVGNISGMINELTARHVICFIDFHDSVDGNTVGWYQTMCAAFKNNPYCFMETPNEPGSNVSGDQITIINALRAGGWTNPIGLELQLGYQFDNIGPTMASISQNNQIFLCPHNYGDWWNNNMQNSANATGLYSVVDEFGDAMDGVTIDGNGPDCVRHIIQSQQNHECGAAVWSATNGYHQGDNLFLDPQGNTIASMGQIMLDMGWLSDAGGITPPPPPPPSGGSAPVGSVFWDNFPGTSIDTSKWNRGYFWRPDGGGGSSGWDVGENQIGPHPELDVFPVSGNQVQVQVKPSPNTSLSGGNPWLTGNLNTHKSCARTYGYWEVDAKLARNQGLLNAIWLWSMDETNWPSEEIDITETASSSWPNTMRSNVHVPGGENVQNHDNGRLSDAFHKYGVDWQPDTISFYFDRVMFSSAPTPAAVKGPMYLIISNYVNAGGEWWGGSTVQGGDSWPDGITVREVTVWPTRPF